MMVPVFFMRDKQGHGMTKQYLRVYRMLVNAGHSGSKALEIVIDARRGDMFSMRYIRYVRKGKA